MSRCMICANAEYHGFEEKESPEREAGAACFWCSVWRDHKERADCRHFEFGERRDIDEHWRVVD